MGILGQVPVPILADPPSEYVLCVFIWRIKDL